jgi:hypothetical protein
MVRYERDCDPATESCFLGCDDDECTSKYTYKYIYKHAANIFRECGADITDCPAAQVCSESEIDRTCRFEYCDPLSEDECAESKDAATQFNEDTDIENLILPQMNEAVSGSSTDMVAS